MAFSLNKLLFGCLVFDIRVGNTPELWAESLYECQAKNLDGHCPKVYDTTPTLDTRSPLAQAPSPPQSERQPSLPQPIEGLRDRQQASDTRLL